MKRRYWSGNIITRLKPHEIFVFGSNPEARHGAGAAKIACNFGAERSGRNKVGIAHGRAGNTYAIVTKNLTKGYTDALGRYYPQAGERSVPISWIEKDIDALYTYAKEHPDLDFLITYQYRVNDKGQSEKSLNGYTGLETLNMFYRDDIPDNIIFHDSYQLTIEAKQQKLDEKYHFFVNTVDPGSQWHPSLFVYKERTFISCEQFMMYSKAMLFQDTETAEKILNLNELATEEKNVIDQWKKGIIKAPEKTHLNIWNEIQRKIKLYGREVKNFDQTLWNTKNESIVYIGNREKFYQNQHLANWMYSKKNKIFVEAAWYDPVWGIGLGRQDPRRFYPEQWQGENRLGKTLQKVCETMYPNIEDNMSL